MASLVICTGCRRHIRHHERQCPFCGAQRAPTAGVLREGMARDATRATLIALGLTVAGPACGGKSDDDRSNVGVIPPYGIAPGNDPGGSGGSGGSGGGDGGAPDLGEGDGNIPVPPYGAMPPPDPDGDAGSGNTPDPETPDAGGHDAGASETPDADAGE